MVNLDPRYIEDLEGDEIKLLVFIADYINKGRTSFPSVKTLASRCKWSESKVNRIKKTLINKGHLNSAPRFNPKHPGQTSNLYTVVNNGVQKYTPPSKLDGGGVQIHAPVGVQIHAPGDVKSDQAPLQK